MVVNSVTIAKWFNRYRGLAMGFSSMGIGIGTMLMAPLAGYVVKHFNWRNGFFSFGLLLLVAGILTIYFFLGKSGPEQMGLLPDGDKPNAGIMPLAAPTRRVQSAFKPVLKSMQYWILVCSNVLAVMTVMMTFSCHIVYAINQGVDDLKAAAALGIIGVTGSCGKLFFGWYCDRVKDAKYAAAIGFIIMTVGLIILYRTKSVAMLYSFAFIYGFGYGSMAPVMPYLVSDRFEKQVLGSAYGLLIFFSTGVGGSIGPVLGGYIFDRTGSYGLGWLTCIALLLIAAVLMLALKPGKSRNGS
jgi:sugar phosphate permease